MKNGKYKIIIGVILYYLLYFLRVMVQNIRNCYGKSSNSIFIILYKNIIYTNPMNIMYHFVMIPCLIIMMIDVYIISLQKRRYA